MFDPLFLYKLQNGLLGTPDNYGGALSADQTSQAQNTGLMNFGASLLASSGPSRMPTGLGQTLGPAILQGRQAQQQSAEDQLKSLLLRKQLEKPQQPLMNVPEGGSVYDPNKGSIVFTGQPKEKGLQRTDAGLVFHPDKGKYTDSTGKELSTDEVSSREAQLAANKSALISAAQLKAKLDALPRGSLPAMVESYMQTGQPPTGMARNPQMTAAFWDAVNERAIKDGNTLAAQTAQTRMRSALKPAMEQTQKQYAANQNFLETLDKNISSADEFAKRVGGDSSPVLNSIFNKWKRGVTGDPDVAAFDVLNNSITGEAAKIATGGVGSVGASSDTAIKHQREVMNSAQNYKQWRSAANAMLTEGHNRIASIQDQLTGLTQQSIGNGVNVTAASGPVKVKTRADALKLPAGTHFIAPDGKEYVR